MTPYYQDSAVTIYHGDCREIVTQLGSVDLVLTDPPYPGLRGKVPLRQGGVAKRIVETITVGEPWGDDLSGISLADSKALLGVMVFCSFHSVDIIPTLVTGQKVGLITWYKRNAPNAVRNVPRYTTEFIWLFKKSPGLEWRLIDNTLIDVPMISAGCISNGERVLICKNGPAAHPTQKPLSVMRRQLAVGGSTVLDPFMGSGTTLRAAKDLGRKAIGIEIEERYCEIAARRCSQGVLEFPEKHEKQRSNIQGNLLEEVADG